jgi:hypothetical protein
MMAAAINVPSNSRVLKIRTVFDLAAGLLEADGD